MDDYAGRVLADRYRLPLPPSDEYELTETRAFDTYSGQEVLVRQVPLPEVVEAEVLDAEGLPDGFMARETRERGAGRRSSSRASTRRPSDPAVRRAVEAAQAAARIPDHPRLDQVFDVFAEGGSLWIVSEFVAARPLAALLAEKPLTPYRAAEVASDVLMALRVLHAHGWVHRNITARTVLVCDDGRVMLTGLAVGAAEEALCGYDPVPAEDGDSDGSEGDASRTFGGGPGGAGAAVPPGPRAGEPAIGGPGAAGADPEAARRAAIEARAAGALPVPAAEAGTGTEAPRGPVPSPRTGLVPEPRPGCRRHRTHAPLCPAPARPPRTAPPPWPTARRSSRTAPATAPPRPRAGSPTRTAYSPPPGPAPHPEAGPPAHRRTTDAAVRPFPRPSRAPTPVASAPLRAPPRRASPSTAPPPVPRPAGTTS